MNHHAFALATGWQVTSNAQHGVVSPIVEPGYRTPNAFGVSRGAGLRSFGAKRAS